MQDASFDAIKVELKTRGIPFDVIYGKHPKIRFSRPDGKYCQITCAFTDGDHRAAQNSLSELRRMLREPQTALAPGACPECAKSFAKYGPGVHCSLECAEAAKRTN